MRGLAARRAAGVLAEDVEAFERLGYRRPESFGDLEALMQAPEAGLDLVLRLAPEGRFFGGSWALEVSTAAPVLPATKRGLKGRGRGVVRRQGARFTAKAGDRVAGCLAERLSGDGRLGEALDAVDFEALVVRPDGRPAVRHLGGSIVWVLLPPIVRATPLPPRQPEAIVRALEAFAAAGEAVWKTGPPVVGNPGWIHSDL